MTGPGLMASKSSCGVNSSGQLHLPVTIWADFSEEVAFEPRSGGFSGHSTGQRGKCTEVQKADGKGLLQGKAGMSRKEVAKIQEHTGYAEDTCALLQATGAFDIVRK